MKIKWSGIVAVALIAIGIAAYKVQTKRTTVVGTDRVPRVLLVADLSEADSADACAEIIHSVRAAGERGVQVLELSPDSKSEMLRRYSVLTIPTVLIFDRNGQVVSRFEGENRQTVEAVRTQLAQLH
jgi:thioredoxin-like negative regulator of GroEL